VHRVDVPGPDDVAGDRGAGGSGHWGVLLFVEISTEWNTRGNALSAQLFRE
jgi:hypothetical protein